MAIMNQAVAPMVTYIQKETSNQSFLDMHYFLKSKGIANNDFFLILLDKGLAGVNPRDPNLSAPMKGRIMLECQRNYWYFLREVVTIPEQGGDASGGKRYKLNRANLAMNFLFILNFNQYVEIPRQFGKTIGAVCRYLWCYNFGTTNSEIMFIHKDHAGSKNNLRSLRSIRDALPTYLRFDSLTGADGKKLKVPNTIVTMANPYNNNKITTFASARTRDAANNLGRGMTMPMLYFDEFAFMPYNQIVYEAAAPAFSTASRNAQANNAPFGILMTSTPGDLLTDPGNYAFDVRNTATPWNERFYDMTYQQLIDLKNANTNSDFFMVSYSYQQLGAGPEYFKNMVVLLKRNWPTIRREILLEWAQAATNCPFTDDQLETIKGYLKEPIRTIFFGRYSQYQFQVYEDADTSYPPIVGVDVAGALMQDSSAITIIDSHTTRVTAVLNCNFMPSDDLAEVLYELITKYLPNAVINIERNGGFGVSVIQRLCKTSVKKNLYWTIKDKVIEEAFNGVRSVKRTARVKVYGTDSNKEVRARLIEILYDRVNYHKDKFVSPILYDEMRAMEVKKSGKVEHSDKSHDDTVFSYLMAMYVWYDGQNLAEKFHIYKNTIKTDTDEEILESDFEDQLEKKETIDVRDLDREEDSELNQAIEYISSVNAISSNDFSAQQKLADLQFKESLLANNKDARDAYCKETGLDPSMFSANRSYVTVDLPDSLFGDTDSDNYLDDIDYLNIGGNRINQNDAHVKGNLSNIWNKV